MYACRHCLWSFLCEKERLLQLDLGNVVKKKVIRLSRGRTERRRRRTARRRRGSCGGGAGADGESVRERKKDLGTGKQRRVTWESAEQRRHTAKHTKEDNFLEAYTIQRQLRVLNHLHRLGCRHYKEETSGVDWLKERGVHGSAQTGTETLTGRESEMDRPR